ncbi:helix-turn-helix domain-containing protein [Malaciobacter mytili]|uniref:XRE family transcriptional regulator n=1 Tax=Malaciobacter mytili TaxID=603050 RepID=UPI003BB00678
MIGDRIKEARNHGNFSLDIFSEKLDISKRTLQNYEKNSSEPSVSIVLKMANLCHINEWWLLTGKGKMLDNENKSSTNKSGYEIDVLNVRASAGAGLEHHVIEVIDTIVLDKTLFRTKPDVSKIKLIQVSGDSMQPTLNDGDFVIIDETKTFGVDGIYAIQLHGQILIKRLKFKLNGTIEIISDNKEYSTEIYDPQSTQVPFSIIGMKTLSIQR